MDPGHAAADPCVRTDRLARRPRGLDRGEVSRLDRHQGNPEEAVSRDEILANISLYWFTGAIGSSFWPYYERMHGARPIPNGAQVTVPMGYAEFPRDVLSPPRSLAAGTFTDIHRWTRMPKGVGTKAANIVAEDRGHKCISG